MSKIKKTVKVYENGLKHIHYYAPFLNQITMSFLFNAGSSNENKEELFGISHFVEHMIFNGSTKFPNEDAITEVYNRTGYYQNAGTWVSLTEYYISGRSSQASEAFPVLFDMVFNPLFREEDIEKEKGIVLEEIRMQKNQPYSMLDREVDSRLFSGTTYAHPILGTVDSIKNMRQKLLKDYHNTFYSSNNVIFVTYGGMQFDKLDQLVTPLLSSLKPKKIPEYEIKTRAYKKKNNQVQLKMDVDTPIYMLSVKREKLGSVEQLLAFQFFITFLGGGDGSLLNKKLVFEKNLISSFSQGIAPMRDYSVFYFSASVSQKNLDELKDEYKKYLNSYIDSDVFTEKEFERTKGYMTGRVAREWDDIFAPTEISLFSFPFLSCSLGLDVDFEQYTDRLKKLTRKEVVVLWEKYLSDLLVATDERFGFVEGTVIPKNSVS